VLRKDNKEIYVTKFCSRSKETRSVHAREINLEKFLKKKTKNAQRSTSVFFFKNLHICEASTRRAERENVERQSGKWDFPQSNMKEMKRNSARSSTLHNKCSQCETVGGFTRNAWIWTEVYDSPEKKQSCFL
jgi:hypothetical protein